MQRRKSAFFASLILTASLAWSADAQDSNALVKQICIACHNQYMLQAGLDLMQFDAEQPSLDPVVAEKIIRKLRAGQMPPKEMPRDQEMIDHLIDTLETRLDADARAHKRAGTRPFQRLNRAEYARLVYEASACVRLRRSHKTLLSST